MSHGWYGQSSSQQGLRHALTTFWIHDYVKPRGAKKAHDHYGEDQALMKKSITFKCQNHKFFCFQKRGRPEEAPETRVGLQRMRSVIRVERERGGAGGAGGNLQSCNNVTRFCRILYFLFTSHLRSLGESLCSKAMLLNSAHRFFSSGYKSEAKDSHGGRLGTQEWPVLLQN